MESRAGYFFVAHVTSIGPLNHTVAALSRVSISSVETSIFLQVGNSEDFGGQGVGSNCGCGAYLGVPKKKTWFKWMEMVKQTFFW